MRLTNQRDLHLPFFFHQLQPVNVVSHDSVDSETNLREIFLFPSGNRYLGGDFRRTVNPKRLAGAARYARSKKLKGDGDFCSTHVWLLWSRFMSNAIFK
jgi:hypothetical protein